MKKMRWVFLLVFFFCQSSISSEESKEEDFTSLMTTSSSKELLLEKEERNLWEKCCEKYLQRALLETLQRKEPGIPKVIHFIWLGAKPFPPQSVENVRNWIAHHPGWKIKFWTDRDRFAPCDKMELCDVREFPFQFFKTCFATSKNPGERSDLLRFEILYKEGGVYVDHDADCLQPFDQLHASYDLYAGFETLHTPVVGCHLTLGNGVIGSIARHPLILRVIEMICADWAVLGYRFRGEDGYSKTELVMERTYIKLTEAVKEALANKTLGARDMIFPAAYFFAKEGVPSLYSTHFFANAWADDQFTERVFRKEAKGALHQIEKVCRRFVKVSKIMLIIQVLGFIGLLVYTRQVRTKEKG